MLGKLALWRGALLVSRTQAFVTGKRVGRGVREGMDAYLSVDGHVVN